MPRISKADLDRLQEENDRCKELMFSEKRDLILDLKDALAEFERLKALSQSQSEALDLMERGYL